MSQHHQVSPLIVVCIEWDLLTKHGEEAFIEMGLQLVDLIESQRHDDCIHLHWPPFRCFGDMNWHDWQDRTGRCHRRTCGERRKGGKRLAKWSGGRTLKVQALALRWLGAGVHIILRLSFQPQGLLKSRRQQRQWDHHE